eukprot:Amastigsp_a843960_162.p6 type:complete len:117 gc:universal Amastigsp_a843960_162:1606-1256(-)
MRSMTRSTMPQRFCCTRLMRAASSSGLSSWTPTMAWRWFCAGVRRVTNPRTICSVPATSDWAVQRAILQLLFLSSVAMTAPRCDSIFERQSMLCGSYSLSALTVSSEGDDDFFGGP